MPPNQPQQERPRRSAPMRLRPSGGYRKLSSFQTTEIVYDATVIFCDCFIDKRSRTHDQMIQAARSGRQNVAEGSRASATSSQTELRLLNVARASLEELLLDLEDFLRQRGLRQWAKDDPEARKIRAIGMKNRTDRSDRSDPTDSSAPTFEDYAPWLRHPDPEVVANALICLIHQANYLLDRQIGALEQQFIQEGGYSERLHAARLEERNRQSMIASPDRPTASRQTHPTDRSDPTDPSDGPVKRTLPPTPLCPSCGGLMVIRTARKGPKAGSQFWGCSSYPECKGIVPL